jgi:hypothetical protein
MQYKDLIKLFGVELSATQFQSFIMKNFKDLTSYNPVEGDYMLSKEAGIELGFTNNEALFDEDETVMINKGRPVFSHVNIYPNSCLTELPFNTTFLDDRKQILRKAGEPTETKKGEWSAFGRSYLVDNYKVTDIVVTFDYDPESENLNFVQIRHNNLLEHLKL